MAFILAIIAPMILPLSIQEGATWNLPTNIPSNQHLHTIRSCSRVSRRPTTSINTAIKGKDQPIWGNPEKNTNRENGDWFWTFPLHMARVLMILLTQSCAQFAMLASTRHLRWYQIWVEDASWQNMTDKESSFPSKGSASARYVLEGKHLPWCCTPIQSQVCIEDIFGLSWCSAVDNAPGWSLICYPLSRQLSVCRSLSSRQFMHGATYHSNGHLQKTRHPRGTWKIEGLSTSLTYLSIKFNTYEGTILLPSEKL